MIYSHHMKQIFQTLLALFILILASNRVSANEGRISIDNGNIQCQGISFLQNGQYTVNGRCHGLVYPYQGFYDYYVMWLYKDGSNDSVKLSDVNKGVFTGKQRDRFSQYVITAETGQSPRTPSSQVVVSGPIIPFDGEIVPTQVPVAANSETATPQTETVQEAPVQESNSLLANMSNVQIVFAVVGVLVLLSVVAMTFFKRQ